jgi:hypothetical protein
MPQPKQKSFQDYLFRRIKEKLPPGKTLADAVGDILHLNPDSTYRRIRGEKLLVLDEARELCLHFGISLDGLFNLRADTVVFHRTEIDGAAYDFTSYLKGILSLLQQLESYSKKSIVYLTKGIPLFHILAFPPLLAFRYYFWMRTTFEVPEILQQKFSMDALPASTETIANDIHLLYNKISSAEIWSAESINSTLMQIDYCCDTGLMTTEQALQVTDSLEKMLKHLPEQAGWGRKFSPAENPVSRKDNFQLFYNRLNLGNDIILVTHDGTKTLYVNNDALDYLTCHDEVYCNKVHEKLETVRRRSTLISSVGEKQRTQFFNGLYAKLRQCHSDSEKREL